MVRRGLGLGSGFGFGFGWGWDGVRVASGELCVGCSPMPPMSKFLTATELQHCGSPRVTAHLACWLLSSIASRMLALMAAVHSHTCLDYERPPQATGDADQLKPRSQRARPSFRGTPAEVYVLGGSHTRKAAAAGRLLCSVLGTQHCHLTVPPPAPPPVTVMLPLPLTLTLT